MYLDLLIDAKLSEIEKLNFVIDFFSVPLFEIAFSSLCYFNRISREIEINLRYLSIGTHMSLELGLSGIDWLVETRIKARNVIGLVRALLFFVCAELSL